MHLLLLQRMTPTASRDAVLLLTHSGDFYTVDLVSQALARRGVRPIRFNTDLFPSAVKLSARVGDEHELPTRAVGSVTHLGHGEACGRERARRGCDVRARQRDVRDPRGLDRDIHELTVSW